MLQQYWAVKATHFDELVMFKVGKFYEIFYYDAVFAQQVCKLKWMVNEKKPHVGFPESSLDHHASMIVDAGYKVIIVEQVRKSRSSDLCVYLNSSWNMQYICTKESSFPNSVIDQMLIYPLNVIII